MRLIRLLKYDLAQEIALWVQDKIISVEQAELICSRYRIDYHHQTRRSYGYFILITLGYLFMGLSLITLLSANWDNIPRLLRMTGVIALTLAVNIMGINQAQKGKDTVAVGYFFLGGLFYGASIMLIAQIYHIGEHYPDGVFWWVVGVLPIALLMRSSMLMLLSAGLAYIWFFIESALHFYPYLFPLFLISLGWHCFRIKQSNTIFLLLVAGICFWVEYSVSWLLGGMSYFEFGPENILLVPGIFIAFYGLSVLWINRKNTMLCDYGTLLNVWALRFTIFFLLIFSFEEPWNELLTEHWEMFYSTMGIAMILILFSIGMLITSKQSIIPIIFFSFFYIAVFGLILTNRKENLALPLQVTDNILLVVSGIWLIVQGIQKGISHYFFIGVLTILVTGLLRYIDLVGDYIGATVLFALFAVILLSTAKFWKHHHSNLEHLK